MAIIFLAYFLDDEQTVWRFNLKGALLFYFTAVWARRIRDAAIIGVGT